MRIQATGNEDRAARADTRDRPVSIQTERAQRPKVKRWWMSVHARGSESKTCYIAAGWMRGAVEQLMGSRVQQPRTERMKDRLLMRADGCMRVVMPS
jgi:hypothetical protein